MQIVALQEGDKITWNYAGRLTDGTPFDSGKYWAMLGAGQIIKGNTREYSHAHTIPSKYIVC